MTALGRRIAELGQALLRDAGGSAPRADVPDDRHGLADALVAFDEARASVEGQLGGVVSELGDELASLAAAAAEADRAGAASPAIAVAVGRARGGSP